MGNRAANTIGLIIISAVLLVAGLAAVLITRESSMPTGNVVATGYALANSCANRCGAGYDKGALCQCDPSCTKYPDCCSDYQELCTQAQKPQPTQDSCLGMCGKPYAPGASCQCDTECAKYGECCSDYQTACAQTAAPKPVSSCVGRCGAGYDKGALCQCDPSCTKYPDCCSDYQAVCVAGASQPSCGNNKAEGTEECDGTDLKSATCATKGFHGGSITCDKTCKLNTTSCTSPPQPACGDGKIDAGEECDGQQFGDATCASKGFQGGALSCDKDCKINTTTCQRAPIDPPAPVCGNNKKEMIEECDGTDLAGATCASKGFPGGILKCTQCKYNTTECLSAPVLAGEHSRIVTPDTVTPATMQEFWDGKARFEFVNRFSFPASDAPSWNPDAWRSMNAGNDIVVRGNVWYLFHREYINNAPKDCEIGGLAHVVVRNSTDQGLTWSPLTEIISPTQSYNACNSVDGDAYYDEPTDTWHYIYQCLGKTMMQDATGKWVPTGTPWNICHATRKGANPTGPFTQDPSNPVIKGGALWTRIAPGSGIFDEGTAEIVEKRDGYYYITFHGYKPPYGYRGMARTKDFVTYETPMQAPMLGPADCNKWTNGQWAPGTCIGVGLASILHEGAYYYQLIEGADGDLGGANNKFWELALVRSPTLEASSWERLPAGGVILFDTPVYNAEGADSVGYMRVFKDTDGSIYLLAQRLSNVPFVDTDPKTGNYLYKLTKYAPEASYEFREGPNHVYAISDAISNVGDAYSRISDAQYSPAGNNNYVLKFNGINSTIEMPATNQFSTSSSFALKAKLRIDALPSGTSSFIAGKPGVYWFEHYKENSAMCFYVQTSNEPVATCAKMPLNEWVTLEGRYDGQNVAIHMNGIRVQAKPAASITQSPGAFRVGSKQSTGGFYGSFKGDLEYVKLYQFIPTNNAKVISEQFQGTATPAGSMTVKIRVQNTGTSTWSAEDSIRLGTQNPPDNGVWGFGRVDLAAGEKVAPGEIKTFTFTAKAPAQAGQYPMQFRMLQEGVEWFGETTSNIIVTVGSGSPAPACGNSKIEAGEECDGTELAGKTCTTQGFGTGTLKCTACKLDTIGCVAAPSCGNNKAEGAEECDGTDLKSATCATKGFHGGSITCDKTCKLNTTSCTSPPQPACGDGKIDAGEECDGTLLGGATCTTKGFAGGTIKCAACKLDTASCTVAQTTSPYPATMDAFVTHLYATVLGRTAAPAEVIGQAAALSPTTVSVEDMYRGFFLSAEYQAKQKNDRNYSLDLYRAMLFREPSSAELDYWQNLLATQVMTREQAIGQFAGQELKSYIDGGKLPYLKDHPLNMCTRCYTFTCTDVQNDANNCGTCGNKCEHGCVRGVCRIPTTILCEEIQSMRNTQADASTALQRCINNAPDYSILELPAGKYSIKKSIFVQKPLTIRTQGKTQSMPRCELNGQDCAEIIALPGFEYNATHQHAHVMDVQAPGTKIDHLIINGNNWARYVNGGSFGYNLRMLNCNNCQFTNSITRNATMGTGLEVAGFGTNFLLRNSIAAFNGVHPPARTSWADGITVHDYPNSVFANNEFVDNTDVDLIFGGCQNCIIQNNTIWHTGSQNGKTFAGLMIHGWAAKPQSRVSGATSGNFNGADVSNNTVICAGKCDIGLMVGGDPWYVAPTFGGSIHDNKVSAAYWSGIAIDDAHDMKIYRNRATECSRENYTMGTWSHNIDMSGDPNPPAFKKQDLDGATSTFVVYPNLG